MKSNFTNDFNPENGNTFNELKTALEKAIKSSPKSSVTAHYPQNDYEEAVARMHISANLAAIRKNPNNSKAIKIVADVRLDDGSYSTDIEPDYAKMEMSYMQFANMTLLNFMRQVMIPMVEKLKNWDAEHDLIEEPDPFNAFDGVPESPTIHPSEKPKRTLKCEVELENLEDSTDREVVLEPTKQKLRILYLKATNLGSTYKLNVRLTQVETEYDSIEAYRVNNNVSVSLIKNGEILKNKITPHTVAYRIINEYLEGNVDLDMDAIEQEVLSQPSKINPPQPQVQPADSSPSGCMIAAIIGIMIFLFFILPYLL